MKAMHKFMDCFLPGKQTQYSQPEQTDSEYPAFKQTFKQESSDLQQSGDLIQHRPEAGYSDDKSDSSGGERCFPSGC